MRCEVIQSTPCWRRREECCDCVFVKHDAEAKGMQGLDVICVLAFLSFNVDGIHYPSALVQWFTHVSEEPDDMTGMWMVQPEQLEDGSPVISVIHTDCILHGAHLIPIFGQDFIPSGL
jgi:hypothetical protein